MRCQRNSAGTTKTCIVTITIFLFRRVSILRSWISSRSVFDRARFSFDAHLWIWKSSFQVKVYPCWLLSKLQDLLQNSRCIDYQWGGNDSRLTGHRAWVMKMTRNLCVSRLPFTCTTQSWEHFQIMSEGEHFVQAARLSILPAEKSAAQLVAHLAVMSNIPISQERVCFW